MDISKAKPFNNGGPWALANIKGTEGKQHCIFWPATGAQTTTVLEAAEVESCMYVRTKHSVYKLSDSSDLVSRIKLLLRYSNK